MKLKQLNSWFGALVLTLLWTDALHGVGLRLPNQDPEAIARGNAFVATADNPSAIYYNPAGITQLEGQNIHAGAYFLSTGVQYESPTGQKTETKSDFNTVPQLYYVFSPKEIPFSFGLGVYVPYGLALEWTGNNPFRTAAEKGNLLYLTVNPVVAWKVNPNLSIAIGPTVNYSKATLERGIGLLPNDRFKVTGDGFDFGFNAGVLWQPHSMWSFGLNYHYLTTVKYEGTASTTPSPPFPASTSASTEIRFPQYVVAGISFRPTENWNFEFDVDWTDWDNLNSIVFKGTAFGDQTFPFNYRSSFMYEFGITRKFPNGWFASVGYFYSENSSPDKDFNPIVPDSDLHLGSIGFGHKGKHWDWAAAYQFGYNPNREVKNDESFPLANGSYHILNHAFNLSATFKF